MFVKGDICHHCFLGPLVVSVRTSWWFSAHISWKGPGDGTDFSLPPWNGHNDEWNMMKHDCQCAPDDKRIEIKDEAVTVHQILMRLCGGHSDEWEWKIHPSGVCTILLEVATTAISNQFESERLLFLCSSDGRALVYSTSNLCNYVIAACPPTKRVAALRSSWLPTVPRQRLASDVEVQLQPLIVTQSIIILSLEYNPGKFCLNTTRLTGHIARWTNEPLMKK